MIVIVVIYVHADGNRMHKAAPVRSEPIQCRKKTGYNRDRRGVSALACRQFVSDISVFGSVIKKSRADVMT